MSYRKNRIITNYNRKFIWLGRFLNSPPHHPIYNKIGVIYGSVDRAIKLADTRFHNKN